MRKNKVRLLFIIAVILIITGVSIGRLRKKDSSQETVREITPTIGSLQVVVSTTATVLPQNRLELKPPVNGRIEKIMVQEGDKVKTGQVIAWMSSTERAALLDTARGQSQERLKYWEDVYKPIPLFSPIDGEVIVATIQPGQTITTSDAVIVLSDHLIVRAQVDETDIGKIRVHQKADVTLDAYPDTKITATVGHIYYESQTVNNVTIYNVDLLPEEVPLFFRSGMNASVNFITQSKEGILIIPQEAVHKEKGENFVFVKQNNGKGPLKVAVTLGISDDKNIEVISGVNKNDVIILTAKKYVLPKNNMGTSPFMPSRRR
jgi:macrolide-specific efflux system membrane fusion protein